MKILNEVTTTTSNKVTAETASGDKFVVVYPKVPLRKKLTDIQKVAMYDWLVQERGVDIAEQWAALVLAGDAAADSDAYEPNGAGWKWIASHTAKLSKQNAAGEDEETKETEEKSNYTSLSTIQLKGGAILAGAQKHQLETDEDKAYVSCLRTVHICTIHCMGARAGVKPDCLTCDLFGLCICTIVLSSPVSDCSSRTCPTRLKTN